MTPQNKDPAYMSGSPNMTSNVKIHDSSEKQQSSGCCKKFTDVIIGALENWFAKLGSLVATHPGRTIILALFVSVLCLIGVVEMYSENRGEKLWVASDSISIKHQRWVSDRYPPQSRIVNVIAESDDLLTPSGLKALVAIDKAVKGVYNGTELEWNKICLGVDSSGTVCVAYNILSVWGYNYTKIESLPDKTAILNDLNNPNLTNADGNPINIKLLLGGRTQNSVDKTISSAKAAKFTYFLKNQEVYVASKGKRVDEKGEEWEAKFNKVIGAGIPNIKIFYTSRKQQVEDASSSISGDLQFLFVGYVLIITYLAVMLGSFSRINHKVWLAICGVACVGLAIGIAYGLSSAFQLFVTPVHSILPFLLLGIGVDDVFVIVQNWDNYGGPENIDNTIAQNIALTMRHAGVSILITSFTDICAFFIGATTVLPALRSFCLFAGIGVLAVFLLTCTLFVAFLTLDSRRQRKRRDACCCCIQLEESWQPIECSKNNYLQKFMGGTYSNTILSTPGVIVCLLLFAGLLAGGGYGLSQLKQDFDQDWFLPSDSPSVLFNKAIDKYFSEEGVQAYVYIGDVDYFAEQDKLDKVYSAIDGDSNVVAALTSSWYQKYKLWLKDTITPPELTNNSLPKTEADFYKYLTQFLSVKDGQKFFAEIKRYNTTGLKKIKASRIKFTHKKVEGAPAEVKIMDSIQDAVKAITFKNGFQTFAFTQLYFGWETNKVISTELVRNLLLAGIIVFFVTLFLIANIWVSLMVVSCVVFTLINIAGYMHFWGLTVDTVTTIQLILAIGLSVDYSAHIGHGFMASRKGSRKDRAANALRDIGPAVVHGGFSTFLAFVFLAGSESYVFSTFFKLFFLVVVFGVFHGLVYLPIMLSLIGPKPYSESASQAHNHDQQVEMKPSETQESYKPKSDPNHQEFILAETDKENEANSVKNNGFQLENGDIIQDNPRETIYDN